MSTIQPYESASPTAQTVDDYIAARSGVTRERLETMRELVRTCGPELQESIGYGIPTYKMGRTNAVHFAGYTKHTGFYPSPAVIEAFAEQLKAYAQSKGAVQFPHNQPLPVDLIRTMVQFRLSQLQPNHT